MERKQINYSWTIFLIFVVAISTKSLIAFKCFFGDIIGTPIITILGNISPAFLIGCFIFLSRRRYWTIVANVIIDLWSVANLIYFKANGFALSVEVIKIVDNMSGFWGSVPMYIGFDVLLFPIITILYSVILIYIESNKSSKTNIVAFTIFLVISIVINNIQNYNICSIYQETARQGYLPFSFKKVIKFAQFTDENYMNLTYIHEFSIISFLPASFVFYYSTSHDDTIELTENEKNEIEQIVQKGDSFVTPKTNLIVILYESMESWITDTICGKEFSPFLTKLTKNEHTLFCKKIIPQTKGGNSADGQLIVVTGLLPAVNGLTCKKYDQNTYPSYSFCYNNSAVINSFSNNWNQSILTYKYGFKQLIQPPRGVVWQDSISVVKLIESIEKSDDSFCMLWLTISTHTPFCDPDLNPTFNDEAAIDGMPKKLSDYLKCVRYTDIAIEKLFTYIEKSKHKDNTTIVITGDHTVFRTQDDELNNYAQEHNINLNTSQSYTSLFICSPQITGNPYITEPYYQLDIFPTILNTIGCDNYFWNGTGVNLRDSITRNTREITIEQATIISDNILRSNFFSSMNQNNLQPQ